MNSFFTLHSFLEVGKTQDLPSKFWQTLGDALSAFCMWFPERVLALSAACSTHQPMLDAHHKNRCIHICSAVVTRAPPIVAVLLSP
jgi:hypothetical protein